MAGKILIKGGCVLSLDRSVGNHAVADVLVDNGVVSEVGNGLRARDAEVIDAGDTIVMPGFVDTHRHAWKTLFRNMGGDERPVGPDIFGPHYTADDVYAATLIGLLGAAEAGITTVVDWADVLVDRSFAEASLQAHSESGLRTVLVAAAPGWLHDGDSEIARARDLTSGVDFEGHLAFGPADPTTGDLDRVASQWAAAREAGLRIHAHVGRSLSDRGVVSGLEQRGLLGEDVTLVHCTNLDGSDLDAIASSSAMVSLTPSNEMASGYGAPPLQAFIDRGIRPGLGVGNELAAPGDIFSQMRAANSIQHATLFDLKLSGKAGIPNLLTTREVIRYGTIDGATVAGLGAQTGSLTPGKKADILVLRADRPNIAPINDPIGAVVWGMDTSNVDWVLVGGDVVVREGSLTADLANVRRLAEAAHRRVGEASGLLEPAGSPQ